MTDRIAGECVDRSRAAVEQSVASLRHVRWASDVELLLHRSVSRFLHAEVQRVTRHGATRTPTFEAAAHDLELLAESSQVELLVRRRTMQWRRAVTELLQRLDRDWPLLVRHFDVRPDAAIESVSAPMGDTHQGGRAVFRVRFNDGRALIYKPRPVDAEATFGDIVRWFCGLGFYLDLRSCRALPRREYGWTEFVKPRYCTTASEAARFYERQGAFLALFYFLTGSDCIADNVVVDGEHPVWVDTECLCTPELGAAVRTSLMPEWMSGSVLNTGFVLVSSAEGEAPRRQSGLSAACLEDRSRLFDDEDVLRGAYVEAVRKGFGRAYDFVLSNRHHWTLARPPLALLERLRLRAVPRSTHVYLPLADLLLTTPLRDRHLVSRRVEEMLSRQHGLLEWPAEFIRAELRALSRGDVPYCTVSYASWAMRESAGEAVSGVVTRPAEEVVRERLGRLSHRDRDNQIWLIESFLRLHRGEDVA